jgi:hypothetical protein
MLPGPALPKVLSLPAVLPAGVSGKACMVIDPHLVWAWLHIVLLVYWLGADVGLYLIMVFVKDPALAWDTRVMLIRLAFYIDLFPRVCFALLLPVGLKLTADLGLAPVPGWLAAAAWVAGVAWSALHLAIVFRKGTPLARRLVGINKGYELVMGGLFVGVGAWSLAAGGPVTAGWLALKLLLFGLVFWVILGIDTVFQPFTTILRMGPTGSTPAVEADVTRMTRATMGWALLLYAVVLAIAFLGKVKPFW